MAAFDFSSLASSSRPGRKPTTKALTPDFLSKEKNKIRMGNAIDLVRADIRNVLFCGATRSGKTTCFKVMQDPCHCPDSQTIFSETRGTNFKSFSMKDNKNGKVHNFVLSLIDSPGAFEEQSAESEFKARSNEKIGELIVDCLKHEVAYLNMVVLFLPIGARIDKKDVDAIELFVSMFQNPNADDRSNAQLDEEIGELAQSIAGLEQQGEHDSERIEVMRVNMRALEQKKRLPMALCLTRADGVNDEARDGFRAQLQAHPKLKKYFDSQSLFILFMGCADHKFRDFGSEQQYTDVLEDVAYWRERFFQAIFMAEHRVDLKTTCIFGQRQADVKQLLDGCVRGLKSLPTLDHELADSKLQVENHTANMHKLFQHKLIIEDRADCRAQSAELWELIVSIRVNPNLSLDLKKLLIEPWTV